MSRGVGLAVLADGIQAAFAAGVVAELARQGRCWDAMMGAGLGAQVGVLAVLGEAEEAARRWRRQGDQGCPLLTPLGEVAQRRLDGLEGTLGMLDPWRLPGWLDAGELSEHLAPEAGGVPARLRGSGVRVWVLTLEVDGGEATWENLEAVEAWEAWHTLTAACTFPAGWGAHPCPDGRRRWGGVGLLPGYPPPPMGEVAQWDVVCGFPVPPVPREWLGNSLLELVQRRDEALAARAVESWMRSAPPGTLRLFAPQAELWRQAEDREEAELGVEYPLAWERNSDVVARLLGAGAAAVQQGRGESPSSNQVRS